MRAGKTLTTKLEETLIFGDQTNPPLYLETKFSQLCVILPQAPEKYMAWLATCGNRNLPTHSIVLLSQSQSQLGLNKLAFKFFQGMICRSHFPPSLCSFDLAH